jgi:hypothetical protein
MHGTQVRTAETSAWTMNISNGRHIANAYPSKRSIARRKEALPRF